MKQVPATSSPGQPPSLAADVDHQFGGGGAGDEVAGAEVIEELGLGEPAATLDDFLLQHGDVGSRASEGGSAELEEEAGDVPQCVTLVGDDEWAFRHQGYLRRRFARRARGCRLR